MLEVALSYLIYVARVFSKVRESLEKIFHKITFNVWVNFVTKDLLRVFGQVIIPSFANVFFGNKPCQKMDHSCKALHSEL